MKKFLFSASFLILLIGTIILYTGEFSGYYGTIIYFGNKSKILGIFFILLSLFIGYFELFKKSKKKVEYSKCPECKETFTYKELKNGICPKCDIETIDIDKYYTNNK